MLNSSVIEIQSVKRLYLDRRRVANTVIHEPVSPQAGELLLTQASAAEQVQFREENTVPTRRMT